MGRVPWSIFPHCLQVLFKIKKKKIKKEGEDEVLGAVLENALHRALQVAGSSFPKNTF